MALSEVLAARADNARATASVDCGALGVLTLEALPLRELERLSRGGDADRAIFYAACRELQRTGAELLRSGGVYRPDQVTALVSDAEAAKAADAVRRLSGVRVEQTQTKEAETEQPEREEPKTEQSETEYSPVDGNKVSEVRPEAVQENAEVRHDTVQQDLTENGEIRLSSVQTSGGEDGDGQVSREFLTENSDEAAKADRGQVLWSKTAQTPQNVVKMDKMDSGLRNIEPVGAKKQTVRGKKKVNRAHETKSEIDAKMGSVLHENKSELTRGDVALLHEITSELAETMHETKSESGRRMHESKSEKAEMLHEDTSELAERVARELLDGLRRAAWVR